MRIAWIFPRKRKCGISIYSHEYVQRLKEHVEVEEYDICELLSFHRDTIRQINACDCIHIQYETSFFLKHTRDLYVKLCKRLKRPLFVTLHEVYDTFPFDYPRINVTGNKLAKVFKLLRYDLRHPHQTAYRRHVKKSFFADTLLVHNHHQRVLLEKMNIHRTTIRVFEHPVKERRCKRSRLSLKKPLVLASAGFINPTYNYQLLFQSLESLTIPWRFIWIGTATQKAHHQTLTDIREKIKVRDWENKFLITGWVSDRRRDEILDSCDIYLALFTRRSSSGSLATALSARRLIIATDLPLTRELNFAGPAISIITPQKEALIHRINTLVSDRKSWKHIFEAQNTLCEKLSYSCMANRLISSYNEALQT